MIDEVVVLAAGVGSRMSEITKDRPKCMAPFQNGTMLSRLLGQLRAFPVRRIHIVGGYKIEVLDAYLKSEFSDLPVNLLKNDIYATTNSLISAKIALEQAKGQLLILNSDVVYERELLRRMVESDEPCAFSLDRSCYNEESEKVALGPDGRAAEIAKTLKEEESAGCSADLYRVHCGVSDGLVPKLLRKFLERPRAKNNLFEDFLDQCLLVQRFAAIDITALEWYEIDTVAELHDAESVFRDIA